MQSLLLLTTSFVVGMIVNGGLLYLQRHDRKPAISHHAVKSSRTYAFYIVGHLITSTAFYLFARSFFIGTPYAESLMAAVAAGYITNIIQAFIPARDKFEKYHAFFAYTMAVMLIIVGVMAAITVPHSQAMGLIAKTLALSMVLALPLSRIIDEKRFYRIQFVSLIIFYAEMFVLVLGTN